MFDTNTQSNREMAGEYTSFIFNFNLAALFIQMKSLTILIFEATYPTPQAFDQSNNRYTLHPSIIFTAIHVSQCTILSTHSRCQYTLSCTRYLSFSHIISTQAELSYNWKHTRYKQSLIHPNTQSGIHSH